MCAGAGVPAQADSAMANHLPGLAEDGLDLICGTALEAPFIQHAKHQTWGILLLSWERSFECSHSVFATAEPGWQPRGISFVHDRELDVRSFFFILEMIFTHSFPYIELVP